MTSGKLRYCVDIDGTICTNTEGEYHAAEPYPDAIAAVNLLYELGHYVVLFTARGSGTGLDWREVTVRQMTEWGVKYHELHFGKPAADVYIDDRAINAIAWRSGQFQQTLAAARQGDKSER
jgi:hypothetical protein